LSISPQAYQQLSIVLAVVSCSYYEKTMLSLDSLGLFSQLGLKPDLYELFLALQDHPSLGLDLKMGWICFQLA
jgi:hypothetical protein